MLFWIIASLIVLICLLAFFFASRNNSPISNDSELNDEMKDEIRVPNNSYFKAQLRELEKDIKSGLISKEEAQGAKAELAREMIKIKSETNAKKHKREASALAISTPVFLISIILIALFSFFIYYQVGKPNLPSAPLALRATPEGQKIEIENAIKKVEERLKENPDDARGWAVIAPIYMRMQRFDESVIAYRNILRLLPPSADTQTDLAEALLMVNDGEVNTEIMALLKSASKLDPNH
ncbi:MAG: c-type cytochrome biogenesis protein CcmI, partial [Devosiaceae bacterium]|nr:c-type cytochrome biogenesis protein CcmI [Devosiaceae bacterium]